MIVITRIQGPDGRHHEILGYCDTEDGLTIDEILIREGLATAWTRDDRHKKRLMAVEGEARRDGDGCLWLLSAINIMPLHRRRRYAQDF